MPRSEYGTINIRREDFDYFQEYWEKHKEKHRKQGITSFGGFVTKILYEAIELDEKHNR